MARILAVFAIVYLTTTVAVSASAADVEGGLIVCVGSDSLQSVADQWRKPGSIFHCLEHEGCSSDDFARNLEPFNWLLWDDRADRDLHTIGCRYR